MKKLQDGGINITVLHNHLLRAAPTTLYMHVQGDPVKLATALRAGLALSKTPVAGDTQAPASTRPHQIEFSTTEIDQVIGYNGKATGLVYQFNIPRALPVKDADMEVPGAMGLSVVINFQSIGDGYAAIAGDFVLKAEEVQPVLKALRDSGIEVTALHNHMLTEQPRLFLMHFWATDDALELARGYGQRSTWLTLKTPSRVPTLNCHLPHLAGVHIGQQVGVPPSRRKR